MSDFWQQIKAFQPFDSIEQDMHNRLQRLLLALPDHSEAMGRELAGTAPDWGHLTASAWIVNADYSKVVLLFHSKLSKWLQSGGHIEDGETDLLIAAQREATEETGLVVEPIQTEIFDIDVHLIPEYWNTPDHYHYDVRFIFRADENQVPVVSPESKAVRWVSLDEAATLTKDEPSIARMIEKTRLACL
jgi:8-oxo-dGTP pyrophosphatase MutT (NUDIX family)